MNYEKLVENLNNPKVQSRIASVFILGMVDEVRAIDALRKRYARETDHRVKQAMQSVGGQLAKLKREGYDTIEAICEHFHINRELQSLAAKDEDAKIKDIQQNTKHNQKDDDFNDQLWGAAAGMLQVGGMVTGLSGTMSTTTPNVDMTSNMRDTSEMINQQNRRTPPVRPGTDDISIWIQRLMNETDPEKRISVILHLASTHNVAALPYLANIYWTDSDDRVKFNAKKYGKLMYLNALYWEMVQDGSMQRIMEAKAAQLGVTLSEANTIKVELREAHNQSLEDILAAAEAKRKKRNKR